MATKLAVARAFTDRAIMAHCAGLLTTQEASIVKWWSTELCNRVTDTPGARAGPHPGWPCRLT
jgi:alkylation response protein AidB-like acyl-CoA dehydrogenase